MLTTEIRQLSNNEVWHIWYVNVN